jgi:hypothetical protein
LGIDGAFLFFNIDVGLDRFLQSVLGKSKEVFKETTADGKGEGGP